MVFDCLINTCFAMTRPHIYVLLVSTIFLSTALCAKSDRILLRDIEVLTLYEGRYTEARRSNRVPQLSCLGGTAGCGAFVPKVVQCYNRGTDGIDIQWECKTDMDNAYRFGEITVTCEGYDHPDDLFVLRGSCGLEYYLDLTKEGYAHSHHTDNTHYSGHRGSTLKQGESDRSLNFGALVVIVIFCVVLYVIYVTFLSSNNPQRTDAPPPYSSVGQPPSYNPDFVPPNPPYPTHGNPPYPTHDTFNASYGPQPTTGYATPPPPGYTVPPSQGYAAPPPHGYTSQASGFGFPKTTQGGNSGPGFWSGAATGGVLGYLFGSRSSSQSRQQPYHQPTDSWGRSAFTSGPSSSSSSSTSTGSSTGTRTASGFGGTRRR